MYDTTILWLKKNTHKDTHTHTHIHCHTHTHPNAYIVIVTLKHSSCSYNHASKQ
jgi:hypothetical protein